MHNSTISLFKKLDIEYLMLDGIQRKPYRNLDEIQNDILTFLEFKFPIDTFKDNLEQLESFLGKTHPTRDKFLKYFSCFPCFPGFYTWYFKLLKTCRKVFNT